MASKVTRKIQDQSCALERPIFPLSAYDTKRQTLMDTFEAREDIVMDSLLKLVMFKVNVPLAVDIIHVLMQGSNSTHVTFEKKGGDEFFLYLKAIFSERMARTCRDIYYFEEEKAAGRDTLVCVSLKKRTNNSRQHLILWTLLSYDISVSNHPPVKYIKAFEFVG